MAVYTLTGLNKFRQHGRYLLHKTMGAAVMPRRRGHNIMGSTS